MFERIPLAATCGQGKGGIFIVHGGIFSDPKVTVDHINSFDRKAYPSVCGPTVKATKGLKLMQETMWSGPNPNPNPNPTLQEPADAGWGWG